MTNPRMFLKPNNKSVANVICETVCLLCYANHVFR